MINFLRTKPIHSFLVGIYIISFIFFRNLEKVSFDMTVRSIVITLLVSVFVFASSYFIYRSNRKAGILTTLLVIGFFVYGFIYDVLERMFYKGYWPLSHIHRFLILAYLLFYLIVFVILCRSRRPHETVNYILNVFIATVFLFNLAIGLFSYQKNKSGLDSKNPFLDSLGELKISGDIANKPDVYYIILDGFANEQVLKDFYSDPHPLLYDFLRKNGFFIADSSRCNYPYTSVSLSSSMNLNYLDSLKTVNPFTLVSQNSVGTIFKKMGYRMINIQSGYAVTEDIEIADKTIPIASNNEFERRLMELTVFRIDDVLGYSNYKRITSQVSQLHKVGEEAGPKFSFVHIVCPHPPYIVDSAGKKRLRTALSDMAWEPRADYLQQVKFISKKIGDFISTIIRKSKTPPVIILQSDHGPWISDKNPDHVYDCRTKILNAYFIPDSLRKNIYRSITPVNSFRFLFSQLYGINFSLLPDRPALYSSFRSDPVFRMYND
jgi:hypothetical protein